MDCKQGHTVIDTCVHGYNIDGPLCPTCNALHLKSTQMERIEQALILLAKGQDHIIELLESTESEDISRLDR